MLIFRVTKNGKWDRSNGLTIDTKEKFELRNDLTGVTLAAVTLGNPPFTELQPVHSDTQDDLPRGYIMVQ